uniref:Agglutinin C-terminal domain-containing protein n=1 Tax=viral metagenome TaxID=1070528 RepID=A0A6M3JHK4_9ZZZZ
MWPWKNYYPLYQQEVARRTHAEALVQVWKNKYFYTVNKPSIKPEVVDYVDTGTLVEELFNYLGSYRVLYPLDNYYAVTSLEDVLRRVQLAGVHKLVKILDVHDCDDFAIGLVGEFSNDPFWWDKPFGFIIAGSHVLNIFYAKHEGVSQLYLLEPMTGELVPKETINGEIITMVVIP